MTMKVYGEYEAYQYIHTVRVEGTRFGLDDTQFFIGRYGSFPCTLFLQMFNSAIMYRLKNPHFKVPTFNECAEKIQKYNPCDIEDMENILENRHEAYTLEEQVKMATALTELKKFKPTPLESFIYEHSIGNGTWVDEFEKALDNFVKNVEPKMHDKIKDIIAKIGC